MRIREIATGLQFEDRWPWETVCAMVEIAGTLTRVADGRVQVVANWAEARTARDRPRWRGLRATTADSAGPGGSG
jgi:hypothetical protein